MIEGTAALGLAGNVVQFVCFAWTMLELSREIQHSKSGIVREVFDLETTYGHLQTFARDLKEDPLAMDKRFAEKPDVQRSIQILESIATDCSQTCDKLMHTLQGLRAEQESSFDCLLAALKTAWSKKDIQGLEDQLGRHQKMIELHSNVLTRQQMSHQIDRTEHQMDKMKHQMDKMEHQMDTIEAMLVDLRKQHGPEPPEKGRLSRFFRRIFRREARPSAAEEEAAGC